MDIVVDGLSRHFLRSLEEAANIDVEAQVCEATCDNLCASIMSVLTHLGYQNTRVTALSLCKGFDSVEGVLKLTLALISSLSSSFLAVSTSNNVLLRNMASKDFLKGL